MHFHQLHFVLLDYCVSGKIHRNAKKMQTCSSQWVNPPHFHKTLKVIWEQNAVLTSKSNTLRYKKENRKKFSAAAAIQKSKFPSPCPHSQNCSMVKNTNSLQTLTTVFSTKKVTQSLFWLSLQNLPHKPPNVHNYTPVCAWNPIRAEVKSSKLRVCGDGKGARNQRWKGGQWGR